MNELRIEDAPYVSDGLRDAAALCTPDQALIGARMTMAANMIDRLHFKVQWYEFAARKNQETIKELTSA